MNSDLDQLVQLQTTELKISELRTRIEDIPREIEGLEESLKECHGAVEDSDRLLEEASHDRRRLEAQVEDLRQRLSKFKSQLMEVKSNKEYQAVLHEIAGAEKEISDSEDQILESMLAADEIKERSETAKAEMRQRESEILERKKDLEAFRRESEAEIDVLQTEAYQLRELVPAELMAEYRRIAASHPDGTALAEAKDHSCQSCHIRLRPQVYSELRTNRAILRCERCHRILYIKTPSANSGATA